MQCRKRIFRFSSFLYLGLAVVAISVWIVFKYEDQWRFTKNSVKWFIRSEVLDQDSQRAKVWERRTKPLGRFIGNGTKVILLYTPYFNYMPWGIAEEGSDDACAIGSKKCVVTYSRKDYLKSDAVVFHGSTRHMPTQQDLWKAARQKPLNQRWVWFMQENPVKIDYNPSKLDGLMNWTMTYRSDSDIFYPYFSFRILRPSEKQPISDYSKGKTKLVAWAVSNCGRLREKVVWKLKEYISVDVFGYCQWRFKQNTTCQRRTASCDTIMKQYKFYLSFENENCFQYITEKYFENALQKGIVPIVMGGYSIYNAATSIPGSYISILDFPSAKDLADYLTYLDKNHTAYNEYFKWKTKYKVYEPNWFCRICEKLHNRNAPKKVWSSLGSYWGTEKSCYLNNSYIENVWLKA